MTPSDDTNSLKEALTECARLREENRRLKALLGTQERGNPLQSKTTAITNDSSADAKIAHFRSLFRGRADVYPVRWEGKNGKSGYSPACANEWDRALCRKAQVKCSDCENRKFFPVTDEVIQGHLKGSHTIGVYPMLRDETCWFLAVDFDKSAWREDAGAFLETCMELAVPAAIERSRSGNGGHVGIFFDVPIPAALA
mgnify:CR=1 FL=1